jgi:lysozyme family protein
MTDDNAIIAVILDHEGSVYTDDPADAGGPTRWGITLPVLAQFRRVPESTLHPTDIMYLTREEAIDIYRFLYVQPFTALPISTLRTNVIDMGVNAGVSTSVRLLQQTVGATVDGLLGTQTITLAGTFNWNPVFVGMRVAYYERLIQIKPINMKWRNGWRRRALSFLMPVTAPQTMRRRGRFGSMGKAYGLAA